VQSAELAKPAIRDRLDSLDALRGLVMVVMTLDHVRDFFHDAATVSPTDMATTTPAIFLTRWVTHFCVPVFLFTSGASAWLWMQRRSKSRIELSWYLLSRGLWLILLELVVMRFALDFTMFSSYPIVLITLWGLGVSMILLALLAYLPQPLLLALSIAVICLHNLADGIRASDFGPQGWLWNFLHQQGGFLIGPVVVAVGYPIVPLFAVMAAGFCAGPVLMLDRETRQSIALKAGIGLSLGFVAIRLLNLYGDPAPWQQQSTTIMTVMSFLNCTKYPLSLDFLQMTLGPAMITFAWFERMQFRESNPLIVFGRVPLFYFVAHFTFAHALLIPVCWIRYGEFAFAIHPPPAIGGPAEIYPRDFGFSLGVVYGLWLFMLLVFYPICRMFSSLKKHRKDWWLSYL
jgi:uncharacterized membrane protein